jgi:hypothetical protein
MARPRVAYGQVKQRAERTIRATSPWIEAWGRLGYAAHGVVYGLVGLLAAQAALGTGGATTDSEGALARIVEAPFGQLALAATAFGLVGYATWRFVQALMDTEGKGSDARGVVTRASYAVAGAAHLALAWAAVRLLLGASGADESSDRHAQDWTALLLAQPLGAWLVGLAGAVVVAVGLYQIYLAYTFKFRDDLDLERMSDAEDTWATRAGRLGHAARGVVFGTIGGFLVVAALQSEPGEARGLAGALATLAAEPSGPGLLGAAAIGLIAYGIYSFVEARYRRMAVG